MYTKLNAESLFVGLHMVVGTKRKFLFFKQKIDEEIVKVTRFAGGLGVVVTTKDAVGDTTKLLIPADTKVLVRFWE